MTLPTKEDMRVLIFENLAILRSSLSTTKNQVEAISILVRSFENLIPKYKKDKVSKRNIRVIEATLEHHKNQLKAYTLMKKAISQQMEDLKIIVEKEGWKE